MSDTTQELSAAMMTFLESEDHRRMIGAALHAGEALLRGSKVAERVAALLAHTVPPESELAELLRASQAARAIVAITMTTVHPAAEQSDAIRAAAPDATERRRESAHSPREPAPLLSAAAPPARETTQPAAQSGTGAVFPTPLNASSDWRR